MVKFKVTYLLDSTQKVIYIKASNIEECLTYFYTHYNCDDIISVMENV